MQVKKLISTAIVAGVALCVAAGPVAAKGGGAAKPKVKPTAPKATSHGPKATTHGPKAKSHGPKTSVHGQGQASTKIKGPKTDAGKGKKTDVTPTPTTPPLTQSKAQQLLAKNTNLREKLLSRLPAGTDINLAAEGFRNLGQFVAAVNASYNHNISFAELKALMTGPEAMSLGQAKKQLLGATTPPPGDPVPPQPPPD